MKPKNFPGRKAERQARAQHRAAGGKHVDTYPGKGARQSAHPTVKDQCWRIGVKNRDAITGIARGE